MDYPRLYRGVEHHFMTLSLHIFRGSKCGFYHFNRGSPAVVMVYHLVGPLSLDLLPRRCIFIIFFSLLDRLKVYYSTKNEFYYQENA